MYLRCERANSLTEARVDCISSPANKHHTGFAEFGKRHLSSRLYGRVEGIVFPEE
jgi:hypothetical protein